MRRQELKYSYSLYWWHGMTPGRRRLPLKRWLPRLDLGGPR